MVTKAMCTNRKFSVGFSFLFLCIAYFLFFLVDIHIQLSFQLKLVISRKNGIMNQQTHYNCSE
jgi:hypothetical protein